MNNKSADQPEHLCILISAFVIPSLESIISKYAASEISIDQLVSVAEETGLNLSLSETLNTRFVMLRPKCVCPGNAKIIDHRATQSKKGRYIFEPWHGISSNLVCATSKDSDQPAHMRSIIRAFASHLNILHLSY